MTARKPDRERENALSEAAALRVANDALRRDNERLKQVNAGHLKEIRHLENLILAKGWTQLPHRGYIA